MPPVVLGAELEVAEEDGQLSASHGQDDADEESDPEDVVELLHPDRGEDEEELDIGGSEWQYS